MMAMPTWDDLQNAYDSAVGQYRSQYGEDPSGAFGFNVPGFGYVNVNRDNDGNLQFMHSVPGASGDPGTGYFLKNDNGNIGTAGSYQLGNDGFLSGALPILGVIAPALLGALAPALSGGVDASITAADTAGGLIPEFGSNAAYDAFMNAAAQTPGFDAAMQSAIDGMGDSVGSDWASGLQSAMNPGNQGQFVTTNPASFDNPGSDWSGGDPSAMNPGNQGTYNPIDPATGQPYYDNPGSDWGSGQPTTNGVPGIDEPFFLDPNGMPMTGPGGIANPEITSLTGSGVGAAGYGPGEVGAAAGAAGAAGGSGAGGATSGTIGAGTAAGTGLGAAGSLIPKVIGALLGAGSGAGGTPGAGSGSGFFGGAANPANETPGMMVAPSVQQNQAQQVAQALLLGTPDQPHFNFMGYQPIPDMSQYAKALQGDA